MLGSWGLGGASLASPDVTLSIKFQFWTCICTFFVLALAFARLFCTYVASLPCFWLNENKNSPNMDDV